MAAWASLCCLRWDRPYFPPKSAISKGPSDQNNSILQYYFAVSGHRLVVAGEEHCAWLQVSTTPGPKDPAFGMSGEYKAEALLGKVIERHHRRFAAWLRFE